MKHENFCKIFVTETNINIRRKLKICFRIKELFLHHWLFILAACLAAVAVHRDYNFVKGAKLCHVCSSKYTESVVIMANRAVDYDYFFS